MSAHPSSPTRSESGSKSPLSVLQGTVERVTYTNEETGYSVLRIAPEEGFGPPDVLIRPARVTAVGHTELSGAGRRLRLEGRWVKHPSHGVQFLIEKQESLTPSGSDGLAKYLASDAFKGIGEVLAQRVAKVFPGGVEELIEHPERLAGVRGLRPEVAEGLVHELRVELGTHRSLAFLRGLGLGPRQSSQVLRRLGGDCEEALRTNPYALAQLLPGFGFATADRAARELGIEELDPRRLAAACLHGLKQAADQGHSLLPRVQLLAAVVELLGQEVPEKDFEDALIRLRAEEAVIIEKDVVAEEDGGARLYLPHLATSERLLARHLIELVDSGPSRALANETDLAEYEAGLGFELGAPQREAVLGLLATPIGLLTGGPGVGKTTTLRTLVGLARRAQLRVALASPTGRAAKRLAEATGEEASTVHRLLGFDPRGGFHHDARTPLEADLIVIDEVSMLDVVLAHHLLKAIAPPTRLVLVGDPHQLPSVAPGSVLRDLIESDRVPVHRLTRIYRQDEESLIVENAHRILEGSSPVLPERGDRTNNFYFFPAETAEECADRLVDVVTERIAETFGFDWSEDVQVIAPMYRGACGVDALNDRLREALGFGGLEVRRGERIWRGGDRVVHTRNDYEREIFNGDMGRITEVEADGSLTVRFPDRKLRYEGTQVNDLRPAFAITVHRSQGGEFPVVVIPLVTQHFMMLQRHLLYTAVTRAQKLVVLVGSQRALQMALANVDQVRRCSGLRDRLAR